MRDSKEGLLGGLVLGEILGGSLEGGFEGLTLGEVHGGYFEGEVEVLKLGRIVGGGLGVFEILTLERFLRGWLGVLSGGLLHGELLGGVNNDVEGLVGASLGG